MYESRRLLPSAIFPLISCSEAEGILSSTQAFYYRYYMLRKADTFVLELKYVIIWENYSN